ncbi:MAG: hypothetical protein JZU65_07575, partial [Chlorobium sp.]|nr:hypothetical protein [Chlorobium sp.]
MGENKYIPEPISVMGVNITPFSSYTDACHCIGELIASRGKAFSVAINPEKIYRAKQDDALLALLNRAQVAICDGVGAALAVRFLCDV